MFVVTAIIIKSSPSSFFTHFSFPIEWDCCAGVFKSISYIIDLFWINWTQFENPRISNLYSSNNQKLAINIFSNSLIFFRWISTIVHKKKKQFNDAKCIWRMFKYMQIQIYVLHKNQFKLNIWKERKTQKKRMGKNSQCENCTSKKCLQLACYKECVTTERNKFFCTHAFDGAWCRFKWWWWWFNVNVWKQSLGNEAKTTTTTTKSHQAFRKGEKASGRMGR